MNRTTLLTATLAALALAACAQPIRPPLVACTLPPPPVMGVANQPRICNFANCFVHVNVELDVAACKYTVKADADELQMANKNSARISWILVTQGDRFEFRLGSAGNEYTGGSVFFKGANAPLAPSQFSKPDIAAGKRVWVDNSNTNKLPYEYGVRVYDREATSPEGHPTPLDPRIINDG